MKGLRDTNGRFRRGLEGRLVRWESLAKRSRTAFFAAGGLLFVATVLFAVDAFTGLSPRGTVTGVVGVTGLVLSYVGLLGLYPRLADRSPRVAFSGVILSALPVVFLGCLLVWGASGHAVARIPLPPAVIPAFGTVFTAVFLSLGLGIALFGVASLQTRTVSHTVAALLFVFAATWFLLLGLSSVYGSAFPPWLDFLTFGIMTSTVLALGRNVRPVTMVPP